MANKMLIDAAHPEETRVVTVKGSKVEEFDFEAANRRQLRGNIYLAKVTRVEPSLQAAFVEYGGNRHGFLAFSEIHPDYYQIPIADRMALLEEEARAEREHAERPEREPEENRRRRRRGRRAEASARKPDAVVSAPAEGLEPEAGEHPAAETESAGFAAREPAPEGFGAPDLEDRDAPPRDEAAGDFPAAHGDPVHEAGGPEPHAAAPGSDHPDPAEAEPHGEPVAEAAEPGGDPDRAVTPVEAEPEAAGFVEAAAPGAEAAPAGEGALPQPVAATQPVAGSDADDDEHASDEHASDGPDSDEEDEEDDDEDDEDEAGAEAGEDDEDDDADGDEEDDEDEEAEEPVVEQVGGRGDALAEIPERPRAPRRHYKIQEVIKRRQVILVQVVKEERGTKGAALTTYLSLAGRYSVLMPNTGRGGGISRKITSAADRKRLKEIATDLEVPDGMGVILRTAGASRTKPEIKRDFEYLMRLWESVRELTLSSSAPALVYEEGSLIKRAIRDLYNKDIDEVLVAGDEAYREAKDFMRMLMPSQSKVVKPYRDPAPIFARFGVEQQLDAMFSNHVSLRSGGYLVINPTEALVSIDVNSGRATREHDIEDTALKTNLEAAEEVARQLRLRDLAGLIVIDFIDMEEKRNNRAVEKKLNECLKNDRARIQVGRISPFGLLEMSRQRIRTGVLESSSVPCIHCGGSGFVRATASVALLILRAIEEALIKSSAHNLILRTRTEVALYILNQKRGHLRELEVRFEVAIVISADERLAATSAFHLDRGEPAQRVEPRNPVTSIRAEAVLPPPLEDEDEDEEDVAEESEAEADEGVAESAPRAEAEGEGEDEGGGRRRRRRRRRRGRGDGRPGSEDAAEGEAEGEGEEVAAGAVSIPITEDGEGPEAEERERQGDERQGDERQGDEAGGRRRRRGRRGGRSRDRYEDVGGAIGDEVVAGAEIGEASPTGGSLMPDALAEEIVAVEEIAGPPLEAVSFADPAAPDFQARDLPPRDLPPRDFPPRDFPAKDDPAPDLSALEREAATTAAIEEPGPEAAAPAPRVPVAPVEPEPEPVAVVLTPPDPDRPKRAGWWSRTRAAISGD
ncbi:Ribonuclease E [Methylobacterium crusticola]|uniref:Ribonuclease E n=1 Tax=Methylobacterium crusticola TaxID=1697972 RepID=A0ABQ4R475_9HYPH|nr:ribonuclease E/G [Methylobacterium crusticola]GJD52259.1 Ribonuclease E [Methylobacterium crusticola]